MLLLVDAPDCDLLLLVDAPIFRVLLLVDALGPKKTWSIYSTMTLLSVGVYCWVNHHHHHHVNPVCWGCYVMF